MQKQFERVADRIEKAGAKLCKDMGLPKQKRRCYFYFDTDRALNINAYANGTYIVINRGMQRFVENDDEMAVVMAHEMAHNLMGHTDAKLHNAYVGAVIGALLFNTLEGAKTGAEAAVVAYSESFEDEADYVGLYVMARAGYDVRQAPQFWRRMSIEEPNGVYNSITHPSNAERFVALQKGVEEIEFKRTHGKPLLPEMSGEVIPGDYQAERKIWQN